MSLTFYQPPTRFSGCNITWAEFPSSLKTIEEQNDIIKLSYRYIVSVYEEEKPLQNEILMYSIIMKINH